ncbi:MAG: PIG-L deacetylase family protein [Dehalococcoidales bacterium]|nr:PIG-L deacetylase family protein [Dehalococcoidales bacterium]
MNRSILLVFAHPDDESFGLAGTILKYSQQGVPVDLVCATKGEKGSRIDVPDNISTGSAREDELRAAAAITGIRRIYFLDYIDGELDKADTDEVTAKVFEIMRQLLPEVVITFGPDGISGHGDHIAIGRAATGAFERLSATGAGPRKLYYVTIPASAVPEVGEFGVITRPDDEVTLTVDVSLYLDLKIQAIAAHRSQQDSQDFIEMLRQNRQAGFAIKEHLYRAVPAPTGKESDLFQ